MPTDPIDHIHQMLTRFGNALLVTQGATGAAHARPMAIARIEDDCSVWFFTGRDTTKVYEIQDNQNVLVACQDERSRYLSLVGRAELVADRSKAQELWKESYKTWFPNGVDDPQLLLIRVRPEEAEFWDNSGFKGVRYAFEAARAYLSGTTPRIHEGEHTGKQF